MYKFLFLIILTFSLIRVFGQDNLCRRSTEGTDFWFGFMESRNYHNAHFLEITVTARETSNFNLYIGHTETAFNGTYTVQGNNSIRIKIPWDMVEATGSEKIQDRGIRLVSEKPVNVYALNWDRNSADVAVIYPVESLGNEYFAVCYTPHVDERNGQYNNGRNSEFLVVAAEDSTQVLIIPSKTTDKLVNAGDSIFITLNKGEVYQVQSENHDNLTGQGDLTGSYIQSNKPVAFFSGSLATTVPGQSGTSAWDHLYEQTPPIHSWGREYFAVPLKSREQDRYRIMAAEDNTTVYVSGLPPFVLNRGEFRELVFYYNEPKRIFGDKPILVAQYSQSQSVDKNYTGGNGDPFMIILSSTTQSKNDVTFVAYNSDQIQKYYVNIVTLTSEVNNIRFDENSIQNEFQPFPDSQYSFAQKAIVPGTHHIQNMNEDRGFLAYVYGFGGVESYGYGVGFNLDLILDLGESINFRGDTLLLCYGDSRTLDAGPYFDTYQWNTGDTSQKLTVTTGGKYYVKTTTIDGCVLEDSIFIYVSHPETNLGIDSDEGCAPYSVELNGNDGFDKYLWKNPLGDTLSTNQIFTASQTGEYQLTALDKYGCPARDTMNLTVFPVPEININGNKLICGDLLASLTVSISNAPEDVWNYSGNFTWSSNQPSKIGFSETSHTSAKIIATDWGEYEIYYHLQTINGCEVSDTIPIRFHPNPNSSFEFEDDAKCEGYSKILNFTGTTTDSANFYWDLDGCKFTDTLGWQNYNLSVGAFLYKSPYIKLVIDDNGCWSDTTVNPLGAKPNFTMEADQQRGCDNLQVNFTSTLLTNDNVNYEWRFDDVQTVNSKDVSKYYNLPGFYDVSLTITNPITQCQNSFTIDSMVKVFPVPKAEIKADPEFCYPDSAIIIYTNAIDSSLCYWNFDGIHQSGTGNDTVSVVLDNPVGTVKLIVNEYGCLSDTAKLQLKRKPHFDFHVENKEGCQPYTLEFLAHPFDSLLSFSWFSNNDSIQTGNSGIFTFREPGYFNVGSIATSSATSCFDTLVKSDWILVHPKPNASFEVDYPVALIEHSEISFTNLSENADLYFWDFGDNSVSEEKNPKHNFTELGEFNTQLFVESEFGCKDTTGFLITILPFSVYAPNAFRPDSDIPENRTFMPVGLGADISKFRLRIYDRWGQIIFETKTPEHPWDGMTKNGNPAPMGNYIWLSHYFDIQGFEHNQKGQVLLIR